MMDGQIFADLARRSLFACKSLGGIGLGLAAVWTGSTALAGGNGSSYDGPNLSGYSVPVSPDQKFTLVQAMNATESCLKDAVKDIWEQAYGTSVAEARRREAQIRGTAESMATPHISTFSFAPNSCEYGYALSVTGLRGADFVQVLANRCELPEKSPAQVRIERGGDSISLELPGGLAFLRSSKQIDDQLYDDLGTVMSSKVQNVKLPLELVLNKVSENPSSRVRLVNRATHALSRVSVDVNGYAQCLRTRINSLPREL